MKPRIFKTAVFLLLLAILGAGCEKDDTDYDPNSIIAKWQWLSTSGGFIGTTYPKVNENIILEFTVDSIAIKKLNNQIIFQNYFHVFKDTLIINEIEDGASLFSIKHDTLILNQYTNGVPSLISFFKRIK